LLSFVFNNPENLEEINISHFSTESGDFGMIYLLEQVLPKTPNLNTLSLPLYETRIINQTPYLFVKNLPCLKQLERLMLNIAEAIISEDTLIQFF